MSGLGEKLECAFQQCPPCAVSYGLQLARGPQSLALSPCRVPRAPGSVVWPAQGWQALPTLRGAGPTRALTTQSSGLLLAVSLLGQRLCLATRGQCSPRWAWLAQCVRVCGGGGTVGRGDSGRGKAHFPQRPLVLSSPERGNGSLQAKPVPITPCSQHFWAVHASFENLPESSRG